MELRPTTPPLLQGPTAKEKKYDRQLRLWAASGQEALENAKILLLNSGPGVVGVETLKNLILPGAGSFVIVDEADVTEKDLGVNFFLSYDSLGKSRAVESCTLLKELNPEVNGRGIKESPSNFIQNPDVLNQFSLIILIGPSPVAHRISEYASLHSIPLFYVHCVGFYSQFSVQLPAQFPIVDTHPDPASTQDLRLLNPWPELVDFTKRKIGDLDSLNDHDHGHVPYLLLLLHFLDKWKNSHDGQAPTNYSEKKEFKSMVEKAARTSNPEGGEENFDEAVAAVLKSLNPPSISSGLRDIFDNEDCKSPSASSANFWIIARAIRQFHTKYNVLPLPGAIPDMKAQSADYVDLQTVYKRKARQDLSEVTATVRETEKGSGKTTSPIPEKEIEAFCKGAAFVKLIHGRPIPLTSSSNPETPIDWTHRGKPLLQDLQMNGAESLLPIVLAFFAYDNAPIPNPNPNPNPQTPTPTATKGLHLLNTLLTTTTATSSTPTPEEEAEEEQQQQLAPARQKLAEVLLELDRAGGAELHNIAALTGGMVAQEVIKVVTRQYVPVDNTCVFDGVGSRSGVFRV